MQYLNQPWFRQEENIFILCKVDFSTGEPGFSEHTSVAGGAGMEIGRFSNEEDLQRKSLEFFGQKARGVEN